MKFEMFNKKKSESNVEVVEPTKEKNEKKNKLLQITEETIEKIKGVFTYEKLKNATPEKRKIVFDKVKTILIIAAAAGVTLAVQNFGAMDNVTSLENTADASPETIKESIGVGMVVLSGIGIWIKNMYNKEREQTI